MLLEPAKASEESISGKAYLLIQSAMNEFKGRVLDISRYLIMVEDTETSRFVVFIDADDRGNTKTAEDGEWRAAATAAVATGTCTMRSR
jgi:hypothetical protein